MGFLFHGVRCLDLFDKKSSSGQVDHITLLWFIENRKHESITCYMYVYSVFAQFSSHVVLHVPESKVSTQLLYSVLEGKKIRL